MIPSISHQLEILAHVKAIEMILKNYTSTWMQFDKTNLLMEKTKEIQDIIEK